MTRQNTHRQYVEQREQQIAATPPERHDVMDELPQPWPRRVTVSLYSSRDAMISLGKAVGLSAQACTMFQWCCAHVGIVVDVYEDGSWQRLGLEIVAPPAPIP